MKPGRLACLDDRRPVRSSNSFSSWARTDPSAGGVERGVEVTGPGAASLIRDGRPFPEAAAIRRERLCSPGVDETTDLLFVKLDDEVAIAAVAGGEEVAMQT